MGLPTFDDLVLPEEAPAAAACSMADFQNLFKDELPPLPGVQSHHSRGCTSQDDDFGDLLNEEGPASISPPPQQSRDNVGTSLQHLQENPTSSTPPAQRRAVRREERRLVASGQQGGATAPPTVPAPSTQQDYGASAWLPAASVQYTTQATNAALTLALALNFYDAMTLSPAPGVGAAPSADPFLCYTGVQSAAARALAAATLRPPPAPLPPPPPPPPPPMSSDAWLAEAARVVGSAEQVAAGLGTTTVHEHTGITSRRREQNRLAQRRWRVRQRALTQIERQNTEMRIEIEENEEKVVPLLRLQHRVNVKHMRAHRECLDKAEELLRKFRFLLKRRIPLMGGYTTSPSAVVTEPKLIRTIHDTI
ncbi:BZIP domain-containing protein [Pseudoscourfieldia marina]